MDARTFTLVALAPFAPMGEGAPLGRYAVAPGGLEKLLARLEPSFWVPLGAELGGGLNLRVRSLEDFDPGTWEDRLPPPSDEPRPDLGRLLDLVALPAGGPCGRRQALLRAAGELGRLRDCREAWRGLWLAAAQLRPEPGPARLEILPLPGEGLEGAEDRILQLLMEDPPQLLLVDEPVLPTAAGVERLRVLARLGEALRAPVVAWAGPDFLGLAEWQRLEGLPFLPHHMEGERFVKWRSFRRDPLASWVEVLLNRRLAGGEGGTLVAPVWEAAAQVIRALFLRGWPVDPQAASPEARFEYAFTRERFAQLRTAGLQVQDGEAAWASANLAARLSVAWVSTLLSRWDPGDLGREDPEGAALLLRCQLEAFLPPAEGGEGPRVEPLYGETPGWRVRFPDPGHPRGAELELFVAMT